MTAAPCSRSAKQFAFPLAIRLRAVLDDGSSYAGSSYD